MRFKTHIQENILQKAVKDIKNSNPARIKKFLRKKWEEFVSIVPSELEPQVVQAINRSLKTRYRSLRDISRSVSESEELNEDFAHFWNFMKERALEGTAIFSLLQVWFSIDNIMTGVSTPGDFAKITAYAILWIVIGAAQHIKLWDKWKREFPSEFEKEGKPGAFIK